MSDAVIKTGDRRTKTKSKGLQNVLKNVTKEMYRRNYELAQTNKTLSLLRSVDNIALASHETLGIFCIKLSEAIVKTAEFPFAGILTSPIGKHRLVSYRGFASAKTIKETDMAKFDNLHIDHTADWYRSEHRLAIIKAARLFDNGLEVIPGVRQQTESLNNLVETDLSIKSLALVKLSSSQKIVGVMIIGFQQDVHAVSQNDIDLINRLADSIGLAVESKLLFEENQLVAEQLQKANNKLKALDEAKDDFISMASHQLRTPLTSVKGYISMVQDGDAGRINKEQKEMLSQAYFASQRMVYLIADLLNVSRLKTGKFIIEPTPADLSSIVAQELGQLEETAAAKSLTLTFDKPTAFPSLMLDETKTRQVIMNFVDNAIYYTPAGGKINVRLIDNPETIELRVEDNGIGVPKADQHHLFTKFYRAGNARQARPDGTGLGLFMAKKVISAEGGSLIFESTEGKGSTFGFIFSKSKLAARSKEASPVKETEKELAPVS